MLHIIYGTDRENGRARFRGLLGELGEKCGEMKTVLEGEINNNFFETIISSQGLFGSVTLFVFDCVFDKKEERENLLSHAKDLVLSPNIFLVFEPTLEKSIATELKECDTIVEEFSAKKVDTRPDFNIFSLGDALGKRNKKELWILYQNALSAGFEPEEICNTLFWSVKNMALMKNAKQGDICGLNPFVAQKSQSFAKNYTQKEISNFSSLLISCYHEAHRGGEPMNISLERFILSL